MRVGFAAGVVIELRHQQPRGLLARSSGPATSSPSCGGFQVNGCRLHGRAMRLRNHLALGSLRERPQHEHGFGSAEGHVPTGRMLAAAKLRQPLAGLGIDAAQSGIGLGLRDRAAQAEPLDRFAGPAARRLPITAVVIVALQMAVVARGRRGVPAS